MTIDEILNRVWAQGKVRPEAIEEAKASLRKLIEGKKKGGYGKGLVEDIGALLMGTTVGSMKNGFEEYKKLKAIENERTIGYNHALDVVGEVFK